MKTLDNYLEITEPEIAVLFLDERVILNYHEGKLSMVSKEECPFTIYTYTNTDNDYEKWALFYVPKETVKKVCEYRIDFDHCAWIGWSEKHEDFNSPLYGLPNVTICAKLKANALTIGKTVGELRKLWEWLEK